jgi:two-component system OmpR family response regulator
VRILVVDDEPAILDLLSTALRFQGHAVTCVADPQEALRRANTSPRPELIVLDVMLPGMSGFEVAQRLGQEQQGTDARERVPIIFLTARGDLPDRLRGLRLGDDYLAKPFSLEELGARIKAIARRTRRDEGACALSFADVTLDDAAHEVRRGDGIIDLTPTEYRLLRYLMLNPRLALTRRQILDQVWEYDFGGDARVLETYVSYLRKKLGEPELIQTIRGVGYALREPR